MKPKLRPIEMVPIEHRGQQMVLLRDPLRMSDAAIAVPRQLAPLLALMDGSRDEGALEAALQVRHGVRLASGLLSRLIEDLDTSFLLDSERFRVGEAEALRAYRTAPFRPMTMAGDGYPASSGDAAVRLQSLIDALPARQSPEAGDAIRGLISPHIDYERGGAVYAEVWHAATEAVRRAELVIVFGTDHCGGEGALTLTRQSYETPWGVLPTDSALVDALAEAIGLEVYGEELHHRREHSIELAAVWLHHIRRGESVQVVPILCGSFASFVDGAGEPASHAPFSAAVSVLRQGIAARRTLVVAAADLAHVGPAFGDAYGLDAIGRAQLRRVDERLLSAVCMGDAEAFFDRLKAEGDRYHVCGLPPIYLALKLLDGAHGEAVGYAQCPADPQGMSYVTIAGMLLR